MSITDVFVGQVRFFAPKSRYRITKLDPTSQVVDIEFLVPIYTGAKSDKWLLQHVICDPIDYELSAINKFDSDLEELLNK